MASLVHDDGAERGPRERFDRETMPGAEETHRDRFTHGHFHQEQRCQSTERLEQTGEPSAHRRRVVSRRISRQSPAHGTAELRVPDFVARRHGETPGICEAHGARRLRQSPKDQSRTQLFGGAHWPGRHRKTNLFSAVGTEIGFG